MSEKYMEDFQARISRRYKFVSGVALTAIGYVGENSYSNQI